MVATSVHSVSKAPQKIHASSKADFGENLAIKDNLVVPRKGGIVEDGDLKEPVDIIGSEDDQSIEMLDPTTKEQEQGDSHNSHVAPEVEERVEDAEVELGTDDQAWSAPSQTSDNQSIGTVEAPVKFSG